MPLFHLLIVAIIQGLTEFLPVSSSAHLILLPNLTGLDDQGLTVDIAVHVGTLFAVMLYFRTEVGMAAAGAWSLLRGRVDSQGAWLALCLTISTVPVVIAGGLLAAFDLTAALRSTAVIGWAMLGFGLLLYWAEKTGAGSKPAERLSLRDAALLGLWQAVALIPGTSRAGICITGALRLGYDRTSAARIAMLMSIPTILASGAVLAVKAAGEGDLIAIRDLVIAAGFAFLAALLALSLMMRLLNTVSYTPYVIYRVILGVILLWIAYT
ncbi:MAG: undecaprenyl-diphosphate phosphatase [Pseudomonadota bacterium]